MKHLLLFLLIFLVINLFALPMQQMPVKITRSNPVLINKTGLRRDLANLMTLEAIYNNLKKQDVNAVYYYGFKINSSGDISLILPETSPYLISLNKYVEKIFSKYKWRQSHKLDCKKCLLSSSAYFTVIFSTEENKIKVEVGVVEDNGQIVFSHLINMKRD